VSLPTIRVLAAADVELTVPELAKYIMELGDDEQAELLSIIGRDSADWLPMQLQYITDNGNLTAEGRRLMEQIGTYAHPITD
jgi:hypothetical protein